jgi:hypothetical protein
MKHLRKMMLEELQRRNFAKSAIQYVRPQSISAMVDDQRSFDPNGDLA